jgi:hypothetical protein
MKTDYYLQGLLPEEFVVAPNNEDEVYDILYHFYGEFGGTYITGEITYEYYIDGVFLINMDYKNGFHKIESVPLTSGTDLSKKTFISSDIFLLVEGDNVKEQVDGYDGFAELEQEFLDLAEEILN